MEKKKFNKKIIMAVLGIFILFIMLIASLGVYANSSTNQTFSSITKTIEKITDVEVWANTIVKIGIKENIIRALLLLDDNTSLLNQEINFYLNNSLIGSEFTDVEGYAEIFLNPHNFSLGTYYLNVSFPGNDSFYLNPSSENKIIEIIESDSLREIKFIERNDTEIISESFLSIQTDKSKYLRNETIRIFGGVLINGEKINARAILEVEFNESKIFTAEFDVINGEYEYFLKGFEKHGEYLVTVSFGNLSNELIFYVELEEMQGLICKEFEENVLWSSGFSHDNKGSTSYQTWTPKFTCEEAGGQNCFLQDVSVSSRTIYTSVDDKELNGKSYVQISSLDEGGCDAPEKGVYSIYFVYESVKGSEGVKKGWYCGYDKEESEDLIKFKPKCGIKFTEKFASNSECYGVKAYAPQSTIIDVFKIKYNLCWEE
jgi:hypothetical protein